MRKVPLLLILGTLLLSSCTWLQGADQEGPETVKVGVIAPLTGRQAALGLDLQKLLNYDLAFVNERIKAQGYQVELVYKDGKCDGLAAASAFQKLSDEDISFIIGGACSSESLAIAPLLTDKNIIAVSPTAASVTLADSSTKFFSLSYKDSAVDEALSKEIAKYSKVAILSDAGAPQPTLQENTEVVLNESLPKGSDFHELLKKVSESEAELVFFNTSVSDVAQNLATQAAEITNWHLPILARSVFLSQSPSGFSSKFVTVFGLPQVSSETFKVYRDGVIAAIGELPTLSDYQIASSTDALTVLADAIVASDADPSKVQATLSTNHFSGFLGDIYFGGQTFVQGAAASQLKPVDGSWKLQ